MQKEPTTHNIHIGDYVKEIAIKKRISERDLAEMLSRDPSTISHFYKRGSINTDLLWQLSKKLEYNFFRKFANSLDIELQNEQNFGPITIVLSDHKVTIEENGEITKIREYHKNHAK